MISQKNNTAVQSELEQLEEFKKRKIKKYKHRMRLTKVPTMLLIHGEKSQSQSCENLVKVLPLLEKAKKYKSESFIVKAALKYFIQKFNTLLLFLPKINYWSLLMITYTVLFLILYLNPNPVVCYGMENMSPRVVLTKQAQFQGFLGPKNVRLNTGSGGFHSDSYNYRTYGHPVVEIFKGIPYASPPVDSLRYESPVPFPLKSNEVYSANVTKPACPRFHNSTLEKLPTNMNEYDPLRAIKKIHQLEDCLYLDIYAPLNTKKHTGPGLPVLVYANSAPDDVDNPFDGSSLAAIGQIIVVSFRYRVGAIGFLQPSYFTEDARSNFGLWDQLAALQWIRENINAFGGDENNVCLMGNDLDATLISVLALSPLSQAYGGLFHRLILLNGSPFSPISINHRPLETTVHLARALQCSLHERSSELMNCLRRKPITHLLAAAQTIGSHILSYHFAPSVDGTIIKQELGTLTTINPQFPNLVDSLSRYDILCGLGEGPVLPNIGKPTQFWQNLNLERFVTAAIKLALDMDFDAEPTFTLKQDVIRAIKIEYGDYPLMRDLVSDFLMINPMIQLLNKHSETGKNTYFYVSKNYDPLHKKKHSEIPYIFGNEVYHWKYVNPDRPREKELDLQPFEAMILLIANFVQSGDPNRRDLKDKLRNPENSWPKYKRDQGRYLKFGRTIDLVAKYRHSQVIFWSQVFPALLKQYKNGEQEFNNDNDQFPPHFGHPNNMKNYFHPNNITHIYPTGSIELESTKLSAMTENTVLIIGGLLLLLNLLCFMGIFYQRQRLKKAEMQLRRKYNLNPHEHEGEVKSQEGELEVDEGVFVPDDVDDGKGNYRRKRQIRKGDAAPINGDNERMLELESVESEPYQITRHANPMPPSQTNTSSLPTQQRLLALQQQHPLPPLDTLSETETDNGFGPNFLGPNYDPKTKVSRWMFQQSNNNPNAPNGNGDSSKGRSSPPIELELRPQSMIAGSREEPLYHHQYHPVHHLHHPYHSSIPQPVHIHINTNSRQLPTPPIQSSVHEYLPGSPYQPPLIHQQQQQQQHPYHPINTAGSDIPYADSRATSPSVSNYNPNSNGMGPRRPPNFNPPHPLNNNLSSTNFNNSGSKRLPFQSNSINTDNNSVSDSPTLMMMMGNPNDYESLPEDRNNDNNRNPNTKRTSVVVPLPIRNSIIIRELDSNIDEVESSAPRVQIKSGNSGTLKRSVGVGSVSTENGNLQPTINSNNPSTISTETSNSEPTTTTRVVQGPTGGGVVQKVTFADGL